MCGISGFIDPSKGLSDLLAMQQSLHHRGPDAQGYYFDEGVGLAHNRLSIIDLSASANQPFYFGKWILVFNGEIYNYLEIKKQLEVEGYSFTTHSDTEVLIKGFDRWGVHVVKKIIGMFAFAILDKHTKELFLFRDRLGVKPLHYAIQENTLLFASELKAFLRLDQFQINDQALYDYLSFGYTPAEDTVLRHVKKVAPGTYLKFSSGKAEIIQYWDPEDFIYDPLAIGERELTDQLEELLISSFRYRMVSDVPVGVFFSGGIDSTMLVAILSKHVGQVNTFTIGFDDKNFDETPFARTIASYFKTNHVEKILNVHEAKGRLGDFYKIYDEPFHDSSGIPTSLISEIAKNHGMKVVLSSEGGDELFAGYPSYEVLHKLGESILAYPRVLRTLASQFLDLINEQKAPILLSNKIARLRHLLKSDEWVDFYVRAITTPLSNWENYKLQTRSFLSEKARHSTLHPIEKFMLWDLKYLLPNDFLVKVDRATMYHGVESREPFLDHRLVEFSLRLPIQFKIRNHKSKYLLKKVLERYIPHSYFERPKMGFSIPLFNWFKSDLDKLFHEKLKHEHFASAWPQIDYSFVRHNLNIYESNKTVNKEVNLLMMWKLLSLMQWHEVYRS